MKNKNYKKFIFLFLFLIIVFVLILISTIKKENRIISGIYYSSKSDTEYPTKLEELGIEKEIVNKINEDYYHIELDLNTKKATLDGDEINMSELFDVSEKKLDKIISNSSFENSLNDSLIGNVAIDENTISVENPYSTNTLIVETKDKSVFNNYEDIVDVSEILDDVYLIDYKNALDTQKGYSDLTNNKTISNVITDQKVHIFNNSTNEEIISASSVNDNQLTWGVTSTAMDLYSKKINFENSSDIIKIAVLDTGIYSEHEAFSNKTTADKLDMEYSYNYIDSSKASDVSDDNYKNNGHGTQVAGVIAESTSDNVKIIPIKILDSTGNGDLSNILLAISNVYKNVDIINLSLGMDISELSENSLKYCENLFKTVYDYGTIVVCASGNDGIENVSYPACSEYTIAASSINNNNTISTFSNYGDTIDFALPGENLQLPILTAKDAYSKKSAGTSFSCPFLSSAIALIKSDNPNFTRDDIIDCLKQNSIDLGDTGKDKYFGYGSIDFSTNLFNSPSILSLTTTNTTWAKNNTISGYAISSSNITDYAILTDSSTPTKWTTFLEESNIMNFSITSTTAGTNYIWLKNTNGNTCTKSILVNYIDNTPPTIISQLTSSNITTSSFSTTLKLNDTESGFSKITWYYKKASDSAYTSTTNTYSNTNSTTTITQSKNFTGLQSNTKYLVYARIYDNVGNYIDTKSLTITTKSIPTTNTNNSTNKNTTSNTSNTNTSTTTATATTNTQPIKNGIYVIQSALNTSKVLDISAASTSSGANLQLYSSNNTIAQKFLVTYLNNGYYKIENLNSQKFLDVQAAGKTNGTNVWQYDWNNTAAQQWKIVKTSDGYYSLISKCNNLYLDIAAGKTNNGTNIQVYLGNNTKAQKFVFKQIELTSSELSDGYYIIKSKLNTNKAIDVFAAATHNCANVQLYTSNNTDAQKFKISSLGNGFYKIINVKSSKALDVAYANSSNGTNVWQYSWNSSIAQQWLIKKNSSGDYSFISRCNAKYLDVNCGLTWNGTNIQIYQGNNTNAQKFILYKYK